MPVDYNFLIRKAIAEAVPAEKYFPELTARKQVKLAPTSDGKDYQAHLDALTKECAALTGEGCINANEALSIRALIAYVAHNQNMKEQTLCAIVESYFHVKEIRLLPKQDYDMAVKYLVDFSPITIN